jgi:amidohydrolase
MREKIIERMRTITTHIAEANGAAATLDMMPAPNPVLVNNPTLTGRVVESLRGVVGADAVKTVGLQTVAEDFAHVARKVPSVYYWVGVTPAGQDAATAPDNHSDLFYVDEAALSVGLRTMLRIAIDYLQVPPAE